MESRWEDILGSFFSGFWSIFGAKLGGKIEPRRAKTGQDKGREGKRREGKGKEEEGKGLEGKGVEKCGRGLSAGNLDQAIRKSNAGTYPFNVFRETERIRQKALD